MSLAFSPDRPPDPTMSAYWAGMRDFVGPRQGAADTRSASARATDITGRTVYHCHILDHEDQGMMGVIEVR